MTKLLLASKTEVALQDMELSALVCLRLAMKHLDDQSSMYRDSLSGYSETKISPYQHMLNQIMLKLIKHKTRFFTTAGLQGDELLDQIMIKIQEREAEVLIHNDWSLNRANGYHILSSVCRVSNDGYNF
jgi:hypothetical protein